MSPRLRRLTLTGFLLAIGVIGLPARAHAISISINSTTPTQFMNTSAVYGFVDINALLAPNLFTPAYDIVSASLTFFFHDNAEGYQYQGGSYGSYYYSSGYFSRNVYQYYVNPTESATVAFGNQSVTGGTPLNVDTTSFSHWVYEGCYGSFGCTEYWSAYYNDYYSHGGSFSLGQALSSQSIVDLAADGLLNFSILATGSLVFDYATLTAEVLENVAPLEEIAPIPEPMSLTLLGTGLFGIAAKVRRARRARG